MQTKLIMPDKADAETDQLILKLCIDFLEWVGIPVQENKLTETCFLPGLSIQNGCIVVDRQQLIFPGDIFS